MDDDRNATPENDLAFIRRLIQDSRRMVGVDARPFIVWGALVVIGAAGEYAAGAVGADGWVVWMWLTLVAVGWVVSLAVWAGRRRTKGRVTLAERALAAVWIGSWVAMTLLGFVGFLGGHLAGAGIVASIAAVLGTAYYATSALVDHRGIRRLGIGWWLVAILLFVWQTPHAIALFAVAMAALMIVPGVVLHRRWAADDGAG